MTKQEELAALHELKGHYQSIEQLEKEIQKKRTAFNSEIQSQVDRRSPSYPTKPVIMQQKKKTPSDEESSADTPIYFSVILVCLQIIGIIAQCLLYNSTGYAGNNPPPFVLFIFLGLFQFPALAFLISFMTRTKFSGIAGYIVLCAISTAPSSQFLENSGEIATYLMIGFPAVILILAIVLRIAYPLRIDAKAEQEKSDLAEAERKFEKSRNEWREARNRVEKQVEQEYQPKRDKMEQECAVLASSLASHRTAIKTDTILHQSFHNDIDYIIRLMETGVADSVKEALQIKRSEDTQRKIEYTKHQSELAILNVQRELDEKRRWEEQRAQWARDQAQAERERERIEQAKRAADELESIRKKLEND